MACLGLEGKSRFKNLSKKKTMLQLFFLCILGAVFASCSVMAPTWKCYSGPDLPPDKIAILTNRDGDLFLQRVDGFGPGGNSLSYGGLTGRFFIHLLPGKHVLSVYYSGHGAVGESIHIEFVAEAGKMYETKCSFGDIRPVYSGKTGKFSDSIGSWSAWVEEITK